MVVEAISTAALDSVKTAALKKTSQKFVDSLESGFAKRKFGELKLLLNKGLPEYLSSQYKKCSITRTLINRHVPVSLEECYIEPLFVEKVPDAKSLTASDLLKISNGDAGNFLITGTAGSGKSMFMKHTFLNILSLGYTYYPIFFEFRRMNHGKDFDLLSEIAASVAEYCPSFTLNQLKYGLKNGLVFLLLDGFDEVQISEQPHVSEQLQEIAVKYEKASVIVTSRPSEGFGSWHQYSEYRLSPFDHDQVVEFISKQRFDPERKAEFISDLDEDMFDRNSDFLSNPLLASMMLLTYSTFGQIPEKKIVFYEKCFEVLIHEHDSLKGKFNREMSSGLEAERLEEVFKFFCAFSYTDNKYSFDDNALRAYVSRALSAAGEDAQDRFIIRDFCEAISILQKDGLIYEFSHRSFQEYFYARFAVQDRRLPLTKKVDWLIDRTPYEETVNMIAELDRAYFEDEYLLPEVEKLAKKLESVDAESDPFMVLNKFITSFMVNKSDDEEIEYSAGIGIQSMRTHFLLRHGLRYYKDKLRFEADLDWVALFLHPYQHQARRIYEERDGKLKLHHSNREYIKQIGLGKLAVEVRSFVLTFREYLRRQTKERADSISSAIGNAYA